MSPSHDAAIPNWRRHRFRKGGLSLPPLFPYFLPHMNRHSAHAEGGAGYVVGVFDMHFIRLPREACLVLSTCIRTAIQPGNHISFGNWLIGGLDTRALWLSRLALHTEGNIIVFLRRLSTDLSGD